MHCIIPSLYTKQPVYSGPFNLRPSHLTIPSILRLAIRDANLMFFNLHVIIPPFYKTTFNLRPQYFMVERMVLKCRDHWIWLINRNEGYI